MGASNHTHFLHIGLELQLHRPTDQQRSDPEVRMNQHNQPPPKDPRGPEYFFPKKMPQPGWDSTIFRLSLKPGFIWNDYISQLSQKTWKMTGYDVPETLLLLVFPVWYTGILESDTGGHS